MPPDPQFDEGDCCIGTVPPPDQFAWFEVLDRTHCAIDFIDEKIAFHGALHYSPEYKAKLAKVLELLGELYQSFGNEVENAK